MDRLEDTSESASGLGGGGRGTESFALLGRKKQKLKKKDKGGGGCSPPVAQRGDSAAIIDGYVSVRINI